MTQTDKLLLWGPALFHSPRASQGSGGCNTMRKKMTAFYLTRYSQNINNRTTSSPWESDWIAHPPAFATLALKGMSSTAYRATLLKDTPLAKQFVCAWVLLWHNYDDSSAWRPCRQPSAADGAEVNWQSGLTMPSVMCCRSHMTVGICENTWIITLSTTYWTDSWVLSNHFTRLWVLR